MNPKPQSEKRTDPRISKKIVLQVDANGYSQNISPWTLVTTQNFSAGGVLFTYDRMVASGSKLHLKIHFPEKAIQCEAVVHRASPGAQEPFTHIAASLQGLEDADKKYISSYIR